jgi:hypothetical protein
MGKYETQRFFLLFRDHCPLETLKKKQQLIKNLLLSWLKATTQQA